MDLLKGKQEKYLTDTRLYTTAGVLALSEDARKELPFRAEDFIGTCGSRAIMVTWQ